MAASVASGSLSSVAEQTDQMAGPAIPSVEANSLTTADPDAPPQWELTSWDAAEEYLLAQQAAAELRAFEEHSLSELEQTGPGGQQDN